MTDQPITLPTLHELGECIWRASRRDEGTISCTGATNVARAVLELLEDRVPHWVPIKADDIRPGMLLKRTESSGAYTAFVADRIETIPVDDDEQIAGWTALRSMPPGVFNGYQVTP